MLRKVFGSIGIFRFFFNKWRGTAISIHKTLWFNLIAFPFRDAIKFPFWIYQGTKIEHIGKIKVNGDLHSGMIRIGKRHFFRQSPTVIINIGAMEFNGDCVIMGGTTLHVLGEDSLICFGKEVMIGENVQILVGPKIEIGDYTRIAFGSLLMNADFHYVLNINTATVSMNLAPISIGKYNWIGNHAVIKKGVKTPDYCIVSNGSMLLKDYSDLPLYSLIVGVPGKLKGVGFRRVYNKQHCSELDDSFKDVGVMEVSVPTDLNDPCFDNYCMDDIHVHIE